MPDSTLPPAGPGQEASHGVLAALLGLIGSFGEHAGSLAALAGLESREAAGVYLRALLAGAAAVIFLVFGYVLTLLFVAFAVAALFSVGWIWITLGLAVAHFLGVAGCLIYLRARLRTPVFTATSAEVRRDLEALKQFTP